MKCNELDQFLMESNAIEGVYGDVAFQDALQAWNYAYIMKDNFDTIAYVTNIHRRLLKRLNPKIAGKIRGVPVYIGGEIRAQKKKDIIIELDQLVDIWRFKTNGLSSQEKEEFIRQWHIAFEKIHPFVDGNGRTGRILMNIQRIKLGLPILIIHCGEEQSQYYKWFREEVCLKQLTYKKDSI
jgi:fido (protein-threonine AMPylation protein)